MRVLFLVDSSIGDVRQHPYRLHLGATKKLAKLCEFFIYGPHEHELNTEQEAPIEFNPSYQYDDLLDIFNPDVVIAKAWCLTQGFASPKSINRNVPYVCLEGDYYSLKQHAHEWHKRMGFDLILHRNPIIDEEDISGIKKVWIPLSANEDEFYTPITDGYLRGREQKVVFMGNTDTLVREYDFRRKIISHLSRNNYFDYLGLVAPKIYPKLLKKYIASLTCAGGDLHVILGKVFESMASGTVVLTPWFTSEKALFGESECFFKFKDDLSDIDRVVAEVINDKDKTKKVSRNALEIVNNNHLDKHRTKELYDILSCLISGKEIPEKWGR